MTSIRFRCFRLAAVLAVLASGSFIARAQDDVKKEEPKAPEFKAPPLNPITEKLPSVFYKTKLESLEDLKAQQEHVAKIVEKVMPAVVSVRVGASSGSGVIVSKDGYVLTAGHVSGKPDRDVKVILHNGKTVDGKTLGGNHGIDSGLIKIIDKGEWPVAEMGDSSELKIGAWCMVIAHHGGYKPGRSAPVRLGQVKNNDIKKSTLTTDAKLVGGDSGGPIFDMHGRVIGINSRIGNALEANMHVSINPFRDEWNKIAKGETWGKLGGGGGGFGKNGPYLGMQTELKDDKVVVKSVAPNSPAEKAGIKLGDEVLKLDDKEITGPMVLQKLLFGRKIGDQVTIEIRRDNAIHTLKAEIGKRM